MIVVMFMGRRREEGEREWGERGKKEGEGEREREEGVREGEKTKGKVEGREEEGEREMLVR